jgi:hypothetical protein
MKRTIAVVGMMLLAQAGMVLTLSGTASANVLLGGSTNCTMTTGFVSFLNGLSNTPPNGTAKAEVEGNITCNTPNVTPSITSLTGVFKGIIKFKKSPPPNQARSCANFTGPAPIDKIVATSKYVISWNTSSGPGVHSVVTYTGNYSAVTAPLMNLNFALSTATVTGSFAGSTANLDYQLPNSCPVAAGPNNATSGSLVI